MVGQALGRYRIESKLGQGGMGVVYKARDTRLDRFVALKILTLGKVTDPKRKRRFVQEAKAASALDHPNIIHVYDIDEADGHQFIAMEYVTGKTLDQVIPRNGLRLNELLRYAIQIADALARAHSAGIVHRDLKPGNVMITADRQVKVLDFGLAKLTAAVTAGGDEDTRPLVAVTDEGTILGTPAYMSPEQAEGRQVDARSDIFSFGSVLYEMATGERAFQGGSTVAALNAILHQEPKPAKGLPPELEKLISRCLRKDPQRRIQHMVDVRLSLEDLREESESGTLVSPGAGKSRRRPVIAAAVFLAVLLGAAGAWFLGRRDGREGGPSAPVPLTSYAGEEVQPSFSPDGNQVAFVWDGEHRDNPDIYVKLIGGPEKPLRLTTDPAADLSPAWSPDGRFIAFVRDRAGAGRNAILLIPAIGGPERLVTELGTILSPPGRIRTSMTRSLPFPLLAWEPGGKALIIADRGSTAEPLGLFVVSVETGEKRRLTSPPSSFMADGAPAFAPDGRSLIFSRALGVASSDFYRLPLTADLRAAGEPKRLTDSKAWNASPAWLPGGREFVFAQGSNFFGPFSLWRMAASAGAAPRRVAVAGERGAWPAVSAKGDRLVFSHDMADENIWRVPLHSGAAVAPEKFLSSTRNEIVPMYSPDGRKIVFTSDRSGVQEVWVCDSDGSNPVQLTSFGIAMTGSPHWSPDGKQIVFDGNVEGEFNVYVIRAAGGSPRRLTSLPGDSALGSFSPDGRQIYFTYRQTGPWQVWKMPAEGGEPVQVTRGGGRGAIVSPDGKLIYYERLGELWSVTANGGQEVKVLDSVGFLNYAVTETGIYFIPMCGRPRCASIWFFDLATRKVTRVAATGETLEVGLTVSPDRKFLLYSQVDQSGSDLMLVDNFR